MKDRTDRYLVVGAGPSGLCAARWLTALGIPCEVLERHPDVGGIWDISFPGSPMYESCHFISSRSLSGFAGDPMPDDYPDYPRHDLVLRYLREYADRHDLRKRIEFGVEVAAAEPRGDDGGWQITLAGGERRAYKGVLAAVGNEWRPARAAIPGYFSGEVIHSLEYRSPAQLARRRVLVVGGGNSGCDIAVDAALHGAAALISLRRGYWFVPKHIFGRPTDVFAHSGPELPYWLERPVLETLLRVLVGNLTRLGLAAPDHHIFETHPILNTQILDRLAHGDLRVKPDVERYEGHQVVFQDGSREEVDLVVLATGFTRGVSFLGDAILPDDDVSELFLNVFHRRLPKLFVVGHFTTDSGAFPLIDLQCELVARLISARERTPQRAAAFERRKLGRPPDFSRGVRYKPVKRMANYVASLPYQSYLRRTIADLAC